MCWFLTALIFTTHPNCSLSLMILVVGDTLNNKNFTWLTCYFDFYGKLKPHLLRFSGLSGGFLSWFKCYEKYCVFNFSLFKFWKKIQNTFLRKHPKLGVWKLILQYCGHFIYGFSTLAWLLSSWFVSMRRGFLKVRARRFSAHLKRDILLLSKHEERLPQLCSHISKDDWPCFCSISLCISPLFSFPLHIKRNFWED